MTGSWFQLSRDVIQRVHDRLPADASFDLRKRAVAAARPWGCYGGWPAKCWRRAARAYLAQYDPAPAGPLEARMRDEE